jgi:hypothetical protein
VIGNFDLTTNSNLELVKNIFGLKYPTEDSTPKSIEGDFAFFGLQSTHNILVWNPHKKIPSQNQYW